MHEVLAAPGRTTTTLYSWLERLARETAPRSASLLLGLRWSFGLPSSPLLALDEYSLPANPIPLETVLAERGGLRIVRHDGDRDGEQSLYDHLASGRPAIVGADTFYLHFRPAFRRIHSSRTVLVTAGEGGRFLVCDGWVPASQGLVERAELERSRYSEVPRDDEREPLFAGNPIGGAWFSLEGEPPQVEDPTAWMRERLAWLHDEMTTPRVDRRGRYGIEALRDFRRWLETTLDGEPAAGSVAARRGASLLLRPELSSRLYLGVFLRNAAHRLGDPELAHEVELYRRRLGHWQAAMDVLTKTVRVRRREYDVYIREQFARACDSEERLASTLAARGLGAEAAPPRQAGAGSRAPAHSP